MIRILLVEDDAKKEQKIRELISDVVLDTDCQIETAKSANSAAKLLRDIRFDLLVLDVNLPMREGEEPRAETGANLLRQISVRREYHVPAHVIGLTAYESIAAEYKGLFAEFSWGLIRYDPESNGWERQLSLKLGHIANSKEIDADHSYDKDLCVVTAMPHWELAKVLELNGNWESMKVPGDDSCYYSGTFRRDSKRLSVVAASAIQVGMPAATGLTMKMCSHFKPRYLGIVGIAAGVKGEFGDILVADKTWDYGSGKSKSTGKSDGSPFGFSDFEPAPNSIPLDTELLEKFRQFQQDKEVLKRIEIGWNGSRTNKPLSVQIGPIASGASVLENKPLIDIIKSHDRKLIGVEMEAYGVFLAARVCPSPRPKAFAIKSVCDFADSGKTDDYQEYAAYTSAQYLYEFAFAQLVEKDKVAETQ